MITINKVDARPRMRRKTEKTNGRVFVSFVPPFFVRWNAVENMKGLSCIKSSHLKAFHCYLFRGYYCCCLLMIFVSHGPAVGSCTEISPSSRISTLQYNRSIASESSVMLQVGLLRSGIQSGLPEPALPLNSVTESRNPELKIGTPLALTLDEMDMDMEATLDARDVPDRLPFFEETSTITNVTVQLGGTAFLHCRVHDLQDKTVSWARRHRDDLHLLTFGLHTYSTDSRFSLHFQHPNDWRLQIKYANPRDEGLYECQVSTHPPRIHVVQLIVTVPVVEMVDDHGRVIEEKLYKTGSTIELKCVVSKVPAPAANVMWRHGLRLLNYDTSRGGISVKTDLLPQGAISRLYIANASQRDSGNYTCAISEHSSTTVMVHILNGEHPAAMQHGQSSSSPARLSTRLDSSSQTWFLSLVFTAWLYTALVRR